MSGKWPRNSPGRTRRDAEARSNFFNTSCWEKLLNSITVARRVDFWVQPGTLHRTRHGGLETRSAPPFKTSVASLSREDLPRCCVRQFAGIDHGHAVDQHVLDPFRM